MRFIDALDGEAMSLLAEGAVASGTFVVSAVCDMKCHQTEGIMKSDSSSHSHEEPDRESSPLLDELREQTRLLSEIRQAVELDPCLLEQIGHITCLTANEVHESTLQLKAIREPLEALAEMYRTVHPNAALEFERFAKLRAELTRCCPPQDACGPICHFEPCERHGGISVGDGYSAKSRGYVGAVEVPAKHGRWEIVQRPRHEDDEELPGVALGPFVSQIVPSTPSPKPLDFRSGTSTPPGAQGPVGFRTFTQTELAANWPPDMSGARGGDVVLMSGNLWLKISVDGGKTFTDLDFTKLFEADKTYGGWAGDQVVHYIPAIDCFVLYVQSFTGKGANANRNVVKVALASQADLKKFAGGRAAWRRQWHFTADTFGLGSSWMDFPDITYGQNFLHVNTNVFAGKTGKLFFELPLADMQGGKGLSFLFAFIDDKTIQSGSPAQNVQGDEFYWAAHANNSKMRIFSSRGGDPNYAWREREVANWARVANNDVAAKAPDSDDWISEDHRIIGATRVDTQLWFAWTAASGDGGYGGFKFPFPHVHVVKFDIAQDFKRVDQMQVWNADHAYAYPSLTTNSDNEVGISLAWGGGFSLFGSHAVGILGDFVVWYGAASDATVLRKKIDANGKIVLDGSGNPVIDATRFGDYLHVRLAHPDKRYFGAFGYAVKKDASVAAPERGKFQYSYIEFGRKKLEPSPIK